MTLGPHYFIPYIVGLIRYGHCFVVLQFLRLYHIFIMFMIMCFHLHHFHVPRSALFVYSTLVLSVCIDVVLTLFYVRVEFIRVVCLYPPELHHCRWSNHMMQSILSPKLLYSLYSSRIERHFWQVGSKQLLAGTSLFVGWSWVAILLTRVQTRGIFISNVCKTNMGEGHLCIWYDNKVLMYNTKCSGICV